MSDVRISLFLLSFKWLAADVKRHAAYLQPMHTDNDPMHTDLIAWDMNKRCLCSCERWRTPWTEWKWNYSRFSMCIRYTYVFSILRQCCLFVIKWSGREKERKKWYTSIAATCKYMLLAHWCAGLLHRTPPYCRQHSTLVFLLLFFFFVELLTLTTSKWTFYSRVVEVFFSAFNLIVFILVRTPHRSVFIIIFHCPIHWTTANSRHRRYCRDNKIYMPSDFCTQTAMNTISEF